MRITPAPGLAPGQGAARVLHWVPPYMSSTGKGWWALQGLASYYGHDRPAGPWLEAPRETSPAGLAEWATGELGFPVALEAAHATFITAWPPRLRSEPVWYARPAFPSADKADGRPEFSINAYADSIEGIEAAALDAARELYGPDSRLRIEHIDTICATSALLADDQGKYHAHVEVRCLNYHALDSARRQPAASR